MKRFFALVLLVVGSVCAAVPEAQALPSECKGFQCWRTGGGLLVTIQRLAPQPATHHKAGAGRSQVRQRTESTVTPGCPGNDPNVGGAYDVACEFMTSTCASRGLGEAWLTWIWTRTVPVSGPAARWVKSGFSCLVPPDQVSGGRPAITRAMIQRAFRHLPFAHPSVHIQPEGNVTLVNLPTFYQVRWPGTGYQPGQIATVSLLGARVRIRPAATYTYQFGDGARTGPTSDPGGTYPHGRIRHTYRTDGAPQVRVIAHYTADYSLGAGWQPVDVTVTVAGPPTTVSVREAHAHLLAGQT